MLVAKRIASIVVGLLAACASADDSSRLAQYTMADDSIHQWKLPTRLREISGLALSPDGHLFAVADEAAVIFEIDYVKGAVIRTFSFGDPAVKGDFEGIAWQDGQIHVTTSDGMLYSAAAGNDGEHVVATRVDTGIGKSCEIEGLADGADTDRLYFACKTVLDGDAGQVVRIVEWSVGMQSQVRKIDTPVTSIEKSLKVKDFNPSGIVVDGKTGNFIIVAARQKSLLELAADGRIVAARRFRDPGRHRQAEGIELTTSGKLLIADEGGDKRARLAVYEPRQGGGK